MIQKTLFKQLDFLEKDIVYTPEEVAIDILNWLKPVGRCLDPCKGEGSFFNNMPHGSLWCELREGKDFFDFTDKVDWIIGNPPYSIFENFLRHSFQLANDVCYIVPTNKIFQRLKIMGMINIYGGIYGIRVYGSGSNVGFPFGFSTGAFHFKRNYVGKTEIILTIPHNKPMNPTE